MMRNYVLNFCVLLLCFSVNAQDRTITGSVSSISDGMTLPGVNVIIKGTSRGVQTDFDGNYSITANSGQTLVFSYIGFKTQELIIGAENVYNIELEEETSQLEEVIVVAYGTTTREALVGSVSVIDSKTIENQQVTSPLRALQGTVPGVNLLTSGGQPGTNPTIRIRGFGSINASQDPLIILDGAPFNGNINSISQDQIESLTVLKDAASTSLYGSRGANGVIVITTKKGNLNSDPTITIRSQYGISSPTVGLHDMVGPEDYMKMTWQAIKNNNQYNLGQTPDIAATNASQQLIPTLGYNPYNVNTPIDANGNLVANADLLWNTNWENLLIRTSVPRVNHNISIGGGSEKTSYNFSIDYLNEEGPVIVSDFERVTSRLNVESQVKDWLKIGVNTSFSRSSSSDPDQTSGNTTQVISWIYSLANIYPVYVRDANGNLLPDSNGNPVYDLGNNNGRPIGQPVNATRPILAGEHILASLQLGDEKRIRTNYLGNAFAEINIMDGLKFKSSFSYENYVFDSYSFDDDEIGAAAPVGGRVSRSRNTTTTLNAIQALNFTRDFGKHTISADAIMEAYTLTSSSMTAQGTGLLPNQGQLGDTGTPEAVYGLDITERLNGYLGRVAYDYDNRYFIEGSLRRDGSTKFAEDVRWGTFFSIGASWVLSNESFMDNISFINNLKLRASYGELGNNRGIGFFPYQSVFVTGFPNEGVNGVIPSAVVDPNITWETTASTNFGIDFRLFNNKLSGSVDYYEKESVDLIYNVPLSPSTGAPGGAVLTNAGSIKNYGWEFSLGYQIIDSNNFSWNTNVNFSLDKNEITELTQDEFISGTKLWKEGNSLFDFYLRDWAGVDPADGHAMWYQDIIDQTSGEVIGRTTTKDYAEATRYDVGKSSLPDIIGGVNTNLRYKQFDLSFLFNFSFGAYLLDTDYQGLINSFNSTGVSAHPDNARAWQKPGDITDIPMLTTANNNFNDTSSRFLFANDYVRLKALTFGYNLPTSTLEKTGLDQLRLFVQADNLWTWQSHEGIEPEQSFGGVTNNRSPLQSTISTGVIVQF